MVQDLAQIKSFATVLRSYVKPAVDNDLCSTQIKTIINVVDT